MISQPDKDDRNDAVPRGGDEVGTPAGAESGEAAPEKVYFQSRWAWGWPLIPWAVLIGLQIYLAGDPIFTLLFFFLAAIMTLPRFLRWKNTSYAISAAGVDVRHQTMSGNQDFKIGYAEIVSLEVERGFMDRYLGYKSIEMLLKDGGLAKLTFVPVDADIDDVIRQRMEEASA